MNNLGLTFVLAAVASLSLHCAPVDDDELELESSEAALDNTGLADGVRTTIASVSLAENHLFTSTGRLLITGDTEIVELRKNASGSFDKLSLAQSTNCQFAGITEVRSTIYVNCHANTQSFVYAAPLATLSFRSIYTLSGIGRANGLTSDAQGKLYVAATFQNQILRLLPAANDPFTIAQREVYQNSAGGFTNGLQHYDGSIYWTDFAAIKRNTVDRQFATFKVVAADLAYFDDLYVDAAGVLATDATSNVIRAYSMSGAKTGQTKNLFNGPSSVGRALGRAGLSQNALLVTERGGNRVSIFEPR